MTEAGQRRVALERVYDVESAGVGARVLVDGLWPRGVRRADLDLHSWERGIAPSAELRKWFGHERSRFPEFRERFLEELGSPERREALGRLAALADGDGLVILTATAAVDVSHAEVLRRELIGPAPVEPHGADR